VSPVQPRCSEPTGWTQVEEFHSVCETVTPCNASPKSPEATPGGEITMTSYLVGNITSLSRKPCFPDEKLLRNAIRKSWSLYQNPSCNWPEVTIDHYQEVMVTHSESIIKNRLKHPLAEKSWRRHIRLAIKLRYMGTMHPR